MTTAASASWDLSTSFLGLPATVAYGLVRGAGNLGMQQALSDGTRVSFYILGKGPWKGISELWINDAPVTLPNTGAVHFHQGFEGEIGNGLSAVSTGPDQHVDSFFTSLPSALVPITFSGYAWLALKTAPDPAAPSADLTVLGTYQAQMVRLFDNVGNQTSFDWTQNWAYIIADYLIRKFILREGKPNQPLVAAELARFDWQSFSDAAAYYDVSLGAPPAYVQNVEVDQPAGSSTTWNFVLPSSVQAGSLLVFANREGTVTSVTDSKGNTWVKLYNSFWYALNAVAGATTVTATFSSANHMQGTVAEYSGVANSAPDVSANLASGTGTTATSTSVTPTASGDLILAWGYNSTTNTPVYTAGAGFSLRSTASKNSFLEDEIQSLAGALTATLTINASDAWNIGIVAFKAQPAGSGQKRFSDGGVVYAGDAGDTADSALEQMLLMCRSYLLQRNGKFTLYADQPRSSVFTFNSDNVKPGTLKVYRDSSLRSATNQIVPSFRDLNLADGSSDDATRFAIATDPVLNHYAHQFAVGTRGPGLSPMPTVKPLSLDFGANTPERVWRLEKAMLVRQLGDDVDQADYRMPWSVALTASEEATAVEPGDVCEIDSSLSEEYAGLLFEVQEVDDQTADGSRDFTGLEYEPNAFPDAAPTQQSTIAPDPGDGLGTAASSVDGSGNLQVPMDNTVDSADRYARTTGNSTYRPLSNMLTAHDAGSTVTINIAGFTMRVTGSPDFACSGGSLTSLSYGTRYFVYFDDGTMTGGAETYNATTTKETAINGSGRFFIGSILTPVAGAADTSGNNDGGTGAQAGFLQICLPLASSNSASGGSPSFGNPALASDGDFTTSCQLQETNVTGGSTASQNFFTFERPAFPPTSQTLRITSSSAVTGSGSTQLQYSTDGGSTWTSIRIGVWTAVTDSISLPAGIDINKKLMVRDVVSGTGGFTLAQVNIFEIWVEALA